jgi:hypothetical protein
MEPMFWTNLLAPSSRQKMETAGSLKMLVPIYQSTWSHIPQDCGAETLHHWRYRNSPHWHAAYCDTDDGLTYDGKGSRILHWLYTDLNPSLLTLSQLINSSSKNIRFCRHFHSGIFALLVEFLDLHPQLDLTCQFTPSGKNTNTVRITNLST